MGRIKQLLITIPVIAATSGGGALAQDFRRIPTLDIRQASPQQLRQRFPAQEQARPRPYKLRPGGARRLDRPAQDPDQRGGNHGLENR
ncbi:hypothetical protein PIB19_10140 [Sphingomonas sp. 7/4-4]|uniref:hypothetical protein n=1 Tax=Sphingomonas sp. 7/4-4 TaxID=3018446 RepID=UPI0022F3BC0C|nr:hypothetical protein [Sphingomonas sp. 7/4-4]WBY09610.1 hypothetical protein PIB19_10140 [Sphingomonas sp. 7/4-4]